MYIEFTEDQKQRANDADLVALLERDGQQLKRSGSEFTWDCGGHPISIRDNMWFDHYDQVGGGAIGFVKRFMGLSYPDAIKFILDEDVGEVRAESYSKPKRELNPVPFELPERNHNMNRAFAYLANTRGISRDVIHTFAHEGLIYESKDYHNVVFVGTDKEGVPKHAHKRSTAREKVWRANQRGSDNRFTFNWRGGSDRLFLFEAPIDMLSYITMYAPNWQGDNYLAACSIADVSLNQFLEDRTDIRQVYICFDNDPPGQKAAKYLRQKLFEKGINSEILVPQHKDWNEDLLISAQEEGEVECQTVSQLL